LARQLFTTDEILDAARAVVVERGARGATVESIAAAAGAPIGSIYHRFHSVDALIAAAWLRAVRRTQARALAVPVAGMASIDAAVAIALAMYDHCLAEPQDTLLLDVLPQTALLRMNVGPLREQLAGVNAHIQELMDGLARELLGIRGARGRDLVVLALVDLPHGFVHRQLSGGRSTPARRELLPAAVRAVLGSASAASPRPVTRRGLPRSPRR
jgi:AcrR family transcriptional regulator